MVRPSIREALMVRAAGIVLGLILVVSGVCLAQGSNNLFVLQRSKNKNEVHYDAQLDDDGKLHPKQPVIAYWRMHAEDGRREDLGYFERKKAYGFDVKADGSGKHYTMVLVAYRERPIKLYLKGDVPVAEAVIDGQPAYLKKLFIAADESGLLPAVKYLELHGLDLKTGKPRYEKIIRK
jgi:hypothetical protein